MNTSLVEKISLFHQGLFASANFNPLNSLNQFTNILHLRF